MRPFARKTENFATIFKETDMSKKIRTKNAKYKRSVLGAIAVISAFAMFAGACAQATTDDEEDTGTSTRVDEQVLKNGNFEFFDDNDGTYLLSSPDNWTSGTGSGASASDSASGIIGTTAENWNRLTDPDLPQTLWNNAALDSGDEDYVNYNATPTDLPFADPASAIVEREDDDEDDETDDYYIAEGAEYIDNPYTHGYRWVEEDGETALYNAAGEQVEYYTDEDGNYYTTSDLTEESRIENNVLMIHNYVDDDKQGTQTYYTSSTTLSLEANTAAKISVWVKTSDLYFGGNNDTRTEVIDQRGAYIQLEQTVGGTSLDNFRIENINTAILNPYDEESGIWANGNNGWVQYTIYVSACDYAPTTLTLTVGLGEASNYTLEGYAFFDDITYEKYLSVDEMVEAAGGQEAFDGLVNDPALTTTCNLLSEADEKIFRVDKEVFEQNDSTVDHYSSKYSYHLDLAIASESEVGDRTDVSLDANNLTAGLTVDGDGYTSSKGEVNYAGDNIGKPEEQTTYLPAGMDSINTADDIIANLTVTTADSWSSAIGGNYQTLIDDALRTAVDLPGAGDEANVLLMLSARGAAYESVISDEKFTIEGNGYKLVSFWVKTSELDGRTTVTVSARQAGKTDNYGSFEVDSTTVDAVEINDVEDVYNGWVQCYALVSNSLDEEQSFELVVNYGVTEIRETTQSSYFGGWVAVANISVLTLDETAFGYADSSTRAASLSITEASSSGTEFDSVFGSDNSIETQISRPSSYNGYNGGSAATNSVPVEISEYDRPNSTNDYAGLINKDYFDAYKETYADLVSTLVDSPIAALFGENADWDTVIGARTTQPLLIVNTVRTFAERSAIYNYGYVGEDSSVSSDSYLAVSVRVKVSEGAIATVYLVDAQTKQPLAYTTPEYTFWYDNDGNVLKDEPAEDATREEERANIAYSLRTDGLYEDEDGNLYANLYNLEHEYYDEYASYYDGEGNFVSFEDLKDGEIYYANADRTAYAPHYLVTSDGDAVYSYVSGLDGDAIYNYFVDGEIDESLEVSPFDTEVAHSRYTSQTSTPYSFTVDAIAHPELANKWITTTFYIHTGSATKNYRLELWSGTRDAQTTDGVEEGSYVLFDYSAVTVDESGYNSLVEQYTQDIIDAYRDALTAADDSIVFDSNNENIAYYEELAREHDVTVDLYDYSAMYYTYTLYDSATYIPFNADTADEDESGYNYAYDDFSEQLAVLKINNTEQSGAPMMSMFIDYSAVDQSISMNTSSDTGDDTEEDDTTAATDDTNIWLLTSSIIMVVAILIAIAVLLLRNLRKSIKRKPKVGKNTYNYKKNKRYVRTYVKEHGEAPVNGENDAGTTPADDGSVAEELPAESVQPEEQTTSGDVNDAESAEEQPETEVTPDENGDGSDDEGKDN